MNTQHVQKLIAELRHGDDRRRRAASYKLSKSKDALAASALMRAFHDADGSVRANAIAGLQAIASPEAREFLAARQIPLVAVRKSSTTSRELLRGLGALAILGALSVILSGVFTISWSVVLSIKEAFSTPGAQAIGKQVLEFLAVFTVGVLNSIFGALFSLANPDFWKGQTALQHLWGRWGAWVSEMAVVLFVVSNQPAGLASVGIRTGAGGANVAAMVAGWLAYLGLSVAYLVIWKYVLRRGTADSTAKLDTSKPHIGQVLLYRNRWQRSAHLLELTLAVITEDLVFRGYLVLLLGQRTGTYIPWAILSVWLSIVIHLYQGRDRGTVVFQAVAATFFVVLTVLTQNLLAAIAVHLYYDVTSTLRLWQRATKEGGPPAAPRATLEQALSYASFIGLNLALLGTAALWVIM